MGRKRMKPRMQSLGSSMSSSSRERTEGTPSTLPQTAQSPSSSMQGPQVTENQELAEYMDSIGESGAVFLRSTQGTSTPLPTPQPLQTPSSSQATGSIVTGRPSDDRMGTRTVAVPQAPPPPPCQVCESGAGVKSYMGVDICEACCSFYINLKKKKKIHWCAGNNDCTNFTGPRSCQSCRYQKCIDVGMDRIMSIERQRPKPTSSSDCLIEVFRYAKGILFGEHIQEPQIRKIFGTQWRILLVLASFHKKNVVHEFHKPFEREFQRLQVKELEIDYLISITLYLKPREPCEYTFQDQLDNKIGALNRLCNKQKKSGFRAGNLLLWLSDIKYLAPDTPLDISEADVATLIDNTFIQ